MSNVLKIAFGNVLSLNNSHLIPACNAELGDFLATSIIPISPIQAESFS